MNQMPGAIERLRFAVRTLPGVLVRFSEAESEQRPSPERWTRKEVVGHLIDSASNNHQRKVGGIGGVKTHPAFRGRGSATTAIQWALDFFREQGDVDFGLLVCEPGLVPFYERLGWRRFTGGLLVAQRRATVPFTFNLPMTTPLRLREYLAGMIDLLGPPW